MKKHFRQVHATLGGTSVSDTSGSWVCKGLLRRQRGCPSAFYIYVSPTGRAESFRLKLIISSRFQRVLSLFYRWPKVTATSFNYLRYSLKRFLDTYVRLLLLLSGSCWLYRHNEKTLQTSSRYFGWNERKWYQWVMKLVSLGPSWCGSRSLRDILSRDWAWGSRKRLVAKSWLV